MKTSSSIYKSQCKYFHIAPPACDFSQSCVYEGEWICVFPQFVSLLAGDVIGVLLLLKISAAEIIAFAVHSLAMQ